ncbi:uncharacterized protein LOC134336037 [Trichomycterus rosablanca]|uniref:uncharacterized protein LOC134336037 n=1 Tax=Trichomycterus rosablanca TaxID=2290929 RepID=UPI002F3593DE
MLLMFGILFLITGAVVGSLYQDPAVCTFSPNNQNVSCYAALGRRLYLDPPQKLPRNPGFTLKKINKPSDQTILTYNIYKKNSTVNVPGWQFIINNYTIIINHTEKSDSATYRLEITDDSGSIRETFLHLNIEAPVSSVTVTENCLSIPQRKVFCTAEGDELQYWWNVKSSVPHVLDKENQTLWVDKNFTGSVTCHVKNHVSTETRTFDLHPCPGTTTTTPTTTTTASQTSGNNATASLIIMSVIMLLLMLFFIAAFYMYKKRQAAKKKDSSQEGGELVYARVSHNSSPSTNSASQAQEDGVEYATVATRDNKKKPKQMEDDVQYGELVFNNAAKNKQKKIKAQEDDCVYSQVRQGR